MAPRGCDYASTVRVTRAENMTKRIVICADGTWNRPEKDLEKDIPTNVQRQSRVIRPKFGDDVRQPPESIQLISAGILSMLSFSPPLATRLRPSTLPAL